MSAPVLDFRNTNSLWCSVVVETLARLGLRHAIIAPGSRSAPLTFALARHPQIEALPVLDERSAAFFALGLARQHHRTVALVCTSGTAAANFLPAIIEAHESGVPLLVFTADRPPEMRECGSGQTIDQQKIYGGHVNHYHELAVPAAELGLLQYARQTIAQAFERTQSPFPGPVHLNAPFRDPLPPVEDGMAAKLRGKFDEESFFAHLAPAAAGGSAGSSMAAGCGDPALQRLATVARGVIVAGPAQPADPAAYCAAVPGLPPAWAGRCWRTDSIPCAIRRRKTRCSWSTTMPSCVRPVGGAAEAGGRPWAGRLAHQQAAAAVAAGRGRGNLDHRGRRPEP